MLSPKIVDNGETVILGAQEQVFPVLLGAGKPRFWVESTSFMLGMLVGYVLTRAGRLKPGLYDSSYR